MFQRLAWIFARGARSEPKHTSCIDLTALQNPVALTLDQQKDILDHTYKLLTEFNNGVAPKGSVAPWWETSSEGTLLLLEKGIEYGERVEFLDSSCLTSCRSFEHGA